MVDNFFKQQKRAVETSKKNYNTRYDLNSKERLLEIIRTKMRTTFIGSLDKVEKLFGHLWAHGLKENQLNDREKEWRSVYNDLRARILDLGNDELRALENELKQYNITWERYKY